MKLTNKQKQSIKLELLYWQLKSIENRQDNQTGECVISAWHAIRAAFGDEIAKQLDENVIGLGYQLHEQGIQSCRIQRGRYEGSDFVSVL